jgi:hypothetical protein
MQSQIIARQRTIRRPLYHAGWTTFSGTELLKVAFLTDDQSRYGHFRSRPDCDQIKANQGESRRIKANQGESRRIKANQGESRRIKAQFLSASGLRGGRLQLKRGQDFQPDLA